MNLDQVRVELAEAVSTIPGLRTFPYWAETLTPPAAVVQWPDPFTYDAAMARGGDTGTFPLVVLIGRVDARSAAVELGAYCDGAGPRSVKAVIESHQATAYDSARVESVEFAVLTVGGTEYLAATFQINIIGKGGA